MAASRHEEAKTHVEQMRLLVASGVQQPAASSLSPPPEFAPFLSLLAHIKGRANHTAVAPQVLPEDLIFLNSVIAKMGWTPASEFSSMPLPVLHPQQQQPSPTGQQQLLQHSGQVPCYSLLEDDEDLLQDAEVEDQLGGLREQAWLQAAQDAAPCTPQAAIRRQPASPGVTPGSQQRSVDAALSEAESMLSAYSKNKAYVKSGHRYDPYEIDEAAGFQAGLEAPEVEQKTQA